MMKSIQKDTVEANYPDQLVAYIAYLKNQELDAQLITDLSDELFTHMQKEQMSLQQMREFTKDYLYNLMKDLPSASSTVSA